MAHTDTSAVIIGAVWIRPTGDALDRITKVVRLAHKRGGGPQVQPHVTLLSGMETTMASAELKLKHLALRLKPFKIQLGKIESRQDYFRCLYAKAELSEELAEARRVAYAEFEMNPPPPFEPHLSLLYGNIDETLKQELAAEAGGSLDVSFDVTAVHLVNAYQGVPATSWHTLAERPLGG
jgi:2'-5' RNA ligase